MRVRVVHVFVIESLDESPEFVCVCAEINCVKCLLPLSLCCVLISASMSVFSCCMRVRVSCVGASERRCFLVCIFVWMERVKVGL